MTTVEELRAQLREYVAELRARATQLRRDAHYIGLAQAGEGLGFERVADEIEERFLVAKPTLR